MARFTLAECAAKTTPISNWSKFVAHPLGDRILWMFANFVPLHPNHVTLLANAFGLAAGAAFVRGDRTGLVVGAALFYLSFAIDGIDGALARLTGKTSATGAWLDTMTDFVRSLVCAACLTLGTHRAEPSGGLAVLALGFALSSVIAFYYYLAEVSQKLTGERPAHIATASPHPWVEALRRRGIVPSPFGLPDLEGVCFVVFPLLGRPVVGMAIAVVLGALTRLAASIVVLRRLHAIRKG